MYALRSVPAALACVLRQRPGHLTGMQLFVRLVLASWVSSCKRGPPDQTIAAVHCVQVGGGGAHLRDGGRLPALLPGKRGVAQSGLRVLSRGRRAVGVLHRVLHALRVSAAGSQALGPLFPRFGQWPHDLLAVGSLAWTPLGPLGILTCPMFVHRPWCARAVTAGGPRGHVQGHLLHRLQVPIPL